MVLFTSLCYQDEETSADKRQTMTVQMAVHQDIYGGSLYVDLSPMARSRLSDFGQDTKLSEVTQAMFNCHIRMMGKEKYLDTYDFLSRVSDGYAHLNCPGNACGLGPEEYERNDYGYRLVPHNTDSPIQQLTLLMGLAKLCEMIEG